MQTSGRVLGPAIEDYLKAIYALQEESSGVTNTALARRMGVASPSATNMIKKLTALKLVWHERYHEVRLTPAGERIALEVLRHHRLLELFLSQALGMPWDQVHAEAHRLEHVLSDNLEDYVAAYLGEPTEDPHGDPIPSRTGRVEQKEHSKLADLAPGATVTIRRVSDAHPEHLRHFSNLGLVPHARIHVIDREPFGGPLRLRLSSGEERVLGERLAAEIWVGPASSVKKPARMWKQGATPSRRLRG